MKVFKEGKNDSMDKKLFSKRNELEKKLIYIFLLIQVEFKIN